jgi:DNA repair exonuclease SbcCD ATPase subunit
MLAVSIPPSCLAQQKADTSGSPVRDTDANEAAKPAPATKKDPKKKPAPQPIGKPAGTVGIVRPLRLDDQSSQEADRFVSLREAGDLAQNEYEELDAKTIAQIEKLASTGRCQSSRIDPLLDRTLAAMQQWLTVEKRYWEAWGDAEQKRVESQAETLASIEANQKRVTDLVETEKEAYQELQKRRAGLEQTERTAEKTAEIEALIKEVQGREARLAEAKQQLDTLTAQITDTKASIGAHQVGIRQNLARLDDWGQSMGAYYEKIRATANEACRVAKPRVGK